MRRCVVRHSSKVISSNFLRSPSEQRSFDEAVSEHRAVGADLASNLTSEFVSLQVQLLKYRVVRFADEVAHLQKNPLDGIPAVKSIPLHLVVLFIFYQLGLMIGRLDTQAPVKPPVA